MSRRPINVKMRNTNLSGFSNLKMLNNVNRSDLPSTLTVGVGATVGLKESRFDFVYLGSSKRYKTGEGKYRIHL